MHSLGRRLAFPCLALVLILLSSLVPTAVLAYAMPSEASLVSAEANALVGINSQRTSHGLVRLVRDARLSALARQRAEYMASTDVLSHSDAGGKAVWDLMSEDGITWYGAGEIIAYNSTSGLLSSGNAAVAGWMRSSGHRAIILSSAYNYIGVGLAVSPRTGRRYWAGVFLKGPDRTGAWSRIASVTKTHLSSTRSKVVVRWSGDDTRLQVLTSGFRLYEVQRRADDGAWIEDSTRTATSVTRTLVRGHLWQFRIRAGDRAGNWGPWQTISVRI